MHRKGYINMRKTLVIVSSLCIILVFIYIVSFYNNKIPTEQIDLVITDLEVTSFDNTYIETENVFGYQLPERIEENMDEYSVIVLSYEMHNNSLNEKMKDVRCHPKFQSKLQSMIKTYNSGNGTYYIYIEPQSESGLKQYIFLENKGLSEDEIYNAIMKEQIQLTFYTDGLTNILMTNTGHGLSGVGKYTYKFVIEDCLLNTSI